jgi:DNA-directed RNA polymerase specialized sigma subunit
MTVARSRAIDLRRELRGRKRDPAWLVRMPAQDREIFQFYYENGEDIATIQQRFARHGEALTAEDISRSLDRIEARMDQRLRSRIAYDLYARSKGIASGGLLGYLDHLRLVLAEAEESLRPDIQLLEKRTRRVLEQVQRSMEALDAEERKVLELHYYQQLPAPRIAAAMGLPGPRRVYTLIDRAIAHLRRMVVPARENGAGVASRPARVGVHPLVEETVDRTGTR